MKDWGGGDVAFLTEDGEMITFAVVGEPFLIKGKYAGKETERIGCPIVGLDGFSLLVIGKRVARRLTKYEPRFTEIAFDLIRRGAPGDTHSKYDLAECSVPETAAALLALAKTSNWEDEIAEAVAAANEIAAG